MTKMTIDQSCEALELFRRLSLEQYQDRRSWIARVTDPSFDMAALNSVPVSTPWPSPGEVFELTLDGSDPRVDPIAMVRADGYTDPNWKHSGAKVAGKQTRRCKLVPVGYQSNWDSLQRELAKHGKIPEGQWREPLKQKFSGAPGRPVGVADASWADPGGLAYFPYVLGDGSSLFDWTDGAFREDWLWLVFCE